WRLRFMSSHTAPSTKPGFVGVVAALLTPMRDGGTYVDPEATGRLVTWLVEKGIHGLYIGGTTDEGLPGRAHPARRCQPGRSGGDPEALERDEAAVESRGPRVKSRVG
ncbi:MAG TPA: dihydrodipicolinate synthase family protein, partial [archaeon]|nr:dihydrodipicolinate synthase family protein [archaeon]